MDNSKFIIKFEVVSVSDIQHFFGVDHYKVQVTLLPGRSWSEIKSHAKTSSISAVKDDAGLFYNVEANISLKDESNMAIISHYGCLVRTTMMDGSVHVWGAKECPLFGNVQPSFATSITGSPLSKLILKGKTPHSALLQVL